MRVLLSSQYYHPGYAFGGTVGNAVAISEGLVHLGHDVTVVTTTAVKVDQPPSMRDRTEEVNGVTVHYLGTWGSIRKTRINPSVFWLTRGDRLHFEHLHVIGLYDSIGPPLVRLARRRGIPYTIEPAGMLVQGTRSAGLKRIYHRRIGRDLLGGASAIVVTSDKERRDAISFGCDPARLRKRRNGVDLEPFLGLARTGTIRRDLSLAPDCPLLLFLGRVEPMKNLGQLFAALAGLTDAPWHLAIVGPSESEAHRLELVGLIAQLGLEKRVSWLGARYGAEKMEALSESDLLILVSLSENWGNVVGEAIAAGTPVLVTATCGAAELVAEGAGLVVEPNVVDVRAGIERLLFDSSFRAAVKNALPDIASTLSWDGPIRFMSNLFGEIRCQPQFKHQ
jgi:glycosyltransferase involved in cell wall biosynthesis